MMRIALVLGACVALLSGCSVATRQAASPVRYTLTPAPAAVAQPAAVTSNTTTLRLARIGTPAWLQGTGMVYRLDYRKRDAIAVYADSQWAAPPATLLAPLLREALVSTGAWQAVVGPGVAAQAGANLAIQLEDFSQAFATPQQSTGVLDATATLTANPNGRVLAQRAFHIRVSAQTADAAGGAAALNQASREFAQQLATWLRTTAASR